MKPRAPIRLGLLYSIGILCVCFRVFVLTVRRYSKGCSYKLAVCQVCNTSNTVLFKSLWVLDTMILPLALLLYFIIPVNNINVLHRVYNYSV